MEFITDDTICAISTPIGVGGISVVRVSGKDAIDIAQKVFFLHEHSAELEDRKMILGLFKGKDFSDKCMCVYFKSPRSYTGEDVVEFQCHGGLLLTRKILQTLCDYGCRLAEPGEFTKRSFLNGKISLDEAEGVMDLINAESDREIKAGNNLVEGKLNERIMELQNQLTDIIASVDVVLDYPDEDMETQSASAVKEKLIKLNNQLIDLNKTSSTGLKIRNGCRLVIVGRTNVGKSSLLNCLLNCDRAIVTDIAGTTRDIIEETYEYNGVRFVVTDTAGIRETSDVVESIGVEKSKAVIKNADIVLFVIDGSLPTQNEDGDINGYISDTNSILIVNKSDKPQQLSPFEKKFKNIVRVSAKNKKGILELKQKIFDLSNLEIAGDKLMLTNIRHINLVNKAIESITKTIDDLKNNLPLDLVALNLKEAWLSLGEITGKVATEEIIDAIFMKFCLGK